MTAQDRMPPQTKGFGAMLAIAGVVAAGVFAYLEFAPKSFGDSDIERVKTMIRQEYEGRNVRVTEVTMARESRGKLVGYVKFEAPLLGTVTSLCSASLVDGGKNLIWRCE